MKMKKTEYISNWLNRMQTNIISKHLLLVSGGIDSSVVNTIGNMGINTVVVSFRTSNKNRMI